MADGRIFINYRREDTGGYARSLFDRVSARFPHQVFMDVGGSIEFGADFVEEIQKAVSSCDALIVLIGRHWLDLRDASGRRRLDDPRDFVGLEISTALKRNVRVVPALIGGASMPTEEDLPPELKPLSRRQAVLLSDQDWDHTVQRLIKTLEGALSAQTKAIPRKLPLAWVGSGALAALLVTVVVVYRVVHRQPSFSAMGQPASPARASLVNRPNSPPAVKPETITVPAALDAQKSTPPVGSDGQQPGTAGTNKTAAIAQVREAHQAARRDHARGPTIPAAPSGATTTTPSGAATLSEPNGESFEALVLNGDMAYASGEYQKALDIYSKAYGMKSDNREVRRKIATTLTLLGRPEEAQKYQ